ncbi:MAG: hypothetical protein PVI41_06885 [Roseobacter sp.]|jgi:hypothetical protein
MTLSLNIMSPDTVTIRSCEVVGRWFRNRISFQEQKRIEDILARKLAHAILSSLRILRQGAQVLALPDFLVELPGLALSGVHIMVMEASDGIRSVILRFTEFMGAINNAFQTDIGFHQPHVNHCEKLAVNVLEEICLPILNLCRTFEELKETQIRTKGRGIVDRAREFEFQTELLKRYIYNAGMGHAEANDAYLQRPPRHAPNFIVE